MTAPGGSCSGLDPGQDIEAATLGHCVDCFSTLGLMVVSVRQAERNQGPERRTLSVYVTPNQPIEIAGGVGVEASSVFSAVAVVQQRGE